MELCSEVGMKLAKSSERVGCEHRIEQEARQIDWQGTSQGAQQESLPGAFHSA